MRKQVGNGVWERFFNWQSDMDWAWGPLLPLRPSRSTLIQPWVWARLFLVFTGLGLLLVALIVFVAVMLPRFASDAHLVLPPLVLETLSVLRAMGTDPSARLLLSGLVLSLPLLFFLACLPFHWAWNRRAARLGEQHGGNQQGQARELESAKGQVWPPAIGTYPAASGDPPETGR